MFNFSGSEVVFLLVLGLVVLGPEKLPGVLRRAGRLYGEFKRVTSDAQSEVRRAFAEPIRDIQNTVATYKTEFEAGARSVTAELRADPVPPSAGPSAPGDATAAASPSSDAPSVGATPAADELPSPTEGTAS